jgi:hypothetical protein
MVEERRTRRRTRRRRLFRQWPLDSENWRDVTT